MRVTIPTSKSCTKEEVSYFTQYLLPDLPSWMAAISLTLFHLHKKPVSGQASKLGWHLSPQPETFKVSCAENNNNAAEFITCYNLQNEFTYIIFFNIQILLLN